MIEKARERVLLLGCRVGVSGIEAAYTTDLLYVPSLTVKQVATNIVAFIAILLAWWVMGSRCPASSAWTAYL